MGLNQRQIHYAMARVDELLRGKINKLVGSKLVGANFPEMSAAKLVREVKAGRIVASKACNGVSGYSYISSVFEVKKSVEDRIRLVDYNKKIEKLKKRAQKMKDKLMLVGNEEALKMLEDFEKE
jgi:hypothetical protein